jgi:hypothetical protein
VSSGVIRFSSAFAATLIALSVIAFWPRYLSQPFATIDRYTHVHAAAASLWLLLLIAQPLLIRARRLDLHRVLGRVSYGRAPAIVVSSVLLAHARFKVMDAAAFEAEAAALYLPLFSAVLFSLAYGLAVVHRRAAALHARLMVCTALVLIDPVVGRTLAFHFPPLPNVLLYQAIT